MAFFFGETNMRTTLNPFMYGERSKLDWVRINAGTYSVVLQPGDLSLIHI